MKKNCFLLMFALLCFAGKNNAQQLQMLPCYSDQMRAKLIARHPEVLQIEAQLNEEIQQKLTKIDYAKAARTTSTPLDETGNDTFWYDIPIVIHIIHDYGVENMLDDSIISALTNWNIVYAKENWDTSNVIPTYAGYIPGSNVRYIGKAYIRLHLATIDPNGNPTKGILRHRSYLTYFGSDQAKLDDWPPTSYVNIWSVNLIPAGDGFQAAAYAYQPPGAAADPNGDGIIADYSYMPNSPYTAGEVGKTINHEMGHIFYLIHPWANNNFPQVAVGSDLVDDTPPTWGHNPVGCEFSLPCSNDNSIYDTFGATGYYMIYPSSTGGDSLVNYPDTTNTQNIMDYTYCSRMFTYGQCARMHAALNSDVAGRNNLWQPSNLANTGALAPLPDFKPIPDFFVSAVSSPSALNNNTPTNYMARVNSFTFPGAPVQFNNESWDDTVTNMSWTFTDGDGTTQTSTSLTSTPESFTHGGWVNLSLQATGNNTGDSTIDFPRAVYVANTAATPAGGYTQEFSGADTAQWPMFNYYNNEFKWQMANVGYDDNNSVEYLSFDSRIDIPDDIIPQTGAPGGDFDDLYTIPFDFTGFGSNPCYLNFYYSGTSRTNVNYDEMDIDYAYKTSSGMSSWFTLTKLTAKLDNMGEDSASYTPSSQAAWAPAGFILPAAAKTPYTVFRFRYMPGNDANTAITTGDVLSGGNNYYLDKLSFSEFPAAVNNVSLGNVGVAVVPNPTSGDAFVVVKDADNTIAQVTVTDITGKVIFNTSQQVTGNVAKIQIPQSYIAVPGMYIVQTVTGNQTHTQKLVVE